MAPAASPPITPAATAPPPQPPRQWASAGCGAAIATSPRVAAAAKAVSVFVFVMAHLLRFASYRFNDLCLCFLRLFAEHQQIALRGGSIFVREWPVNAPFGIEFATGSRRLNFCKIW